MRALLLAAGLGTRLRPLTDHLPKCLVPIHGRPLLDYWLETLVGHGVDQILINTHYMAPMVERFLSQSSWMPWVTLTNEETLLGTGGTMLENRKFFENDSLLVAHADNLTIFDTEDFLLAHKKRPSDASMTMMLFKTDDPKSCGIVELDQRGVVQAFHEKVSNPPGNLANAAVYIFEPSIFEQLASLNKKEIDLSLEVIPKHIGHINTYENVNYHRDIGNIASWQEANRSFPLIPANAHNAQAWAGIMAGAAVELPAMMKNLLT
jgi:mannose-1-phosphate guanylyltransferase